MAKPGKPKAEPAAVGRPAAYRPEFAAAANGACENGATDADLADLFGVSRRTITAWKTAHPAFRQACRLGKDAADDRVEASLYHRAVGYSFEAAKIFPPGKGEDAAPAIVPYVEHLPPDTTAAIFWLKNRRPKEWRDRSQHELSGPDGAPIRTQGAVSDLEAARLIARVLLKAEQTIPAPGDADTPAKSDPA